MNKKIIPFDMLLSFFEKSPHAMIFTDNDDHILWINDEACELLGYSKDELLIAATKTTDLGIDHDFNNISAVTKKNGEEITVSTTVSTRNIQGKDYTLITIKQGFFDTLTETEYVERKLVKNTSLSADREVSIWSVDREFRYTSFSAVHKRLMKTTWGCDIKIGLKLPDLITDKNYAQEVRDTYNSILEGTPHRSVDRFLSNSEQEFFRENFGYPIHDKNNTISGIMFYSINITEKIKNEREIRLSLKEKESLLKEVHHRVKNNLQTISSMLNLQMEMVYDETTKRILQDSLTRIKTMGAIHETLYIGDELNEINMVKYCSLLIESFRKLYGSNENNVEIINKIEDINLDVKKAIPVGLIINELITNSMKYAFEEMEAGKITVSLRLVKNEYNLRVSDNGKGLPENIESKKKRSLGTRLVSVFAGQLEGRINYSSGQGLTVDVFFPASF